ncbi:hypothetical protein [Arthrobacter sp. Marseille-P9274]|uniref:hypothetical protein n=1 Tax=Arthrobacter sp. Marseille-P9274 TaxID=2866572 RepID=UPI0021C8A52F|nr:hypothetical protein [Arthrobacter sp. Marseille-P9274]
MSLKSDLSADYRVNKRLLGRITVTAFRVNRWAHRSRARKLKRVLAKALDVVWMQGVVGADMPGRVHCGPGLRLPHGGRGIAIHPNVRIGAGVAFYHRVTLRGFGHDRTNVPTVGDGVLFCVNSAAVGRVNVGNNVTVGAGTVISSDVPDGATAVGAKARYLGLSD